MGKHKFSFAAQDGLKRLPLPKSDRPQTCISLYLLSIAEMIGLPALTTFVRCMHRLPLLARQHSILEQKRMSETKSKTHGVISASAIPELSTATSTATLTDVEVQAPARRRWLRELTAMAGWSLAAGLPLARSVSAFAAPSAAAVDMSQVTLRVGDQTGATKGLLQAAGLLNAMPYKIEWSVFPAATNLHEALKAAAIDIGASNDSPAVTAMAGGSPALVAAAWRKTGSTDTALLVPKGSAVHSIADLRGKTVSPTTRGSVAHYLLIGLLQQAGIPLSDVKLAFLAPNDASAAFSSGDIAAWATWGIFRARAVGALGAGILNDGAKVNTGLSLLSAHPDALKDPAKRAAIAHYSALQDQAYAWGRANRQGFINWYAGFSKQSPDIAAAIYEDNVGYRRVAIDPALGTTIGHTYQTWVDTGLLKSGLNVNSHLFHGIAA